MTPARRDLLRGGVAIAGLAAFGADAHAAGPKSPEWRRLVTGAREPLVDLFEREFVAGRRSRSGWVPGAFADLDDPGRFVWLRHTVQERLEEPDRSSLPGLGSELRLKLLTGSLRPSRAGAPLVWLAHFHRLPGPIVEAHAERFERVMRPALQDDRVEATATFVGRVAPRPGHAAGDADGHMIVQFSGFRTIAEMSARETAVEIGAGPQKPELAALTDRMPPAFRLRLRSLP